jgi:hypothetical protein
VIEPGDAPLPVTPSEKACASVSPAPRAVVIQNGCPPARTSNVYVCPRVSVSVGLSTPSILNADIPLLTTSKLVAANVKPAAQITSSAANNELASSRWRMRHPA